MGICFLNGLFGMAVVFLGKPRLTSIYGIIQVPFPLFNNIPFSPLLY